MSSGSAVARLRRAVSVSLPMVVLAGLATAGPAAAEEVYPRPYDGGVTLRGHGWGHGIGMSQYGAYGGAQAGRTWDQIITYYYTGVSIGSIGNPTMRVRVASLGSTIQALPATGLRVTWNFTDSSVLPTTQGGATVARWRIAPQARVAGTPTKFQLEYLPQGSSTWRYYATASEAQRGAFLNSSTGMVTTLRGSTQVVYRGQVRGTLIGSAGAESLVPVVALPMESYLRSVVPSEMPASWPRDAVAAQAVAARSFAEHHRRYAPLSRPWYDVYDDTRSQVFNGTRVGSTSYEYAASDAAILATAQKAVMYGSEVGFTQFSSSSGGWTAKGSKPYLQAKADPWDAISANPNHTWTTTVTVARIQSAYPQIGSYQRMRITGRTGNGAEGGRVTSLVLEGDKGSVTLTGNGFRSAFGLKSDWFIPTDPISAPSYPRDVTGDRELDVLAVEASTGALRVYPTSGSGTWRAPVVQEKGVWNTYAKALSAGTWDDDAISDALVQDSGGGLYLRRGNGNGTFAAPVKIGSGWHVHNLVFPTGDFDGDGRTDVMARRGSDGALILYSGSGFGGFLRIKQIGSGWNIFTAVFSPGDFTGDGNADVLARAGDGTLYLYPGNGKGGWQPRKVVATGWNVFTALTAGGDFTGDAHPDVLARKADGSLRVYPGNGSGGWLASKAVGSGWNVFSSILL